MYYASPYNWAISISLSKPLLQHFPNFSSISKKTIYKFMKATRLVSTLHSRRQTFWRFQNGRTHPIQLSAETFQDVGSRLYQRLWIALNSIHDMPIFAKRRVNITSWTAIFQYLCLASLMCYTCTKYSDIEHEHGFGLQRVTKPCKVVLISFKVYD